VVGVAKLRLAVEACHALQVAKPISIPPCCAAVLSFQGPFTLITDLVVPQGDAQNYSLVPNPSNSSAGLPVNSTALTSLSLIYTNITILVPCSTLQLYITAMCQSEVDHMTLINRWGILYQQFTSPMVGSTALLISHSYRMGQHQPHPSRATTPAANNYALEMHCSPYKGSTTFSGYVLIGYFLNFVTLHGQSFPFKPLLVFL
jgi:hypothetical protein